MVANRPIYREAYPRFDIIQAEAACIREPSGCLFKCRGMTMGQLVVPESDLNSFLIAYFVRGPYFGYGEGELEIQTKQVRNPVDPNRRVLLCPQCSARKWTIFFKDRWACAVCHNLRHQSQVVDRTYLEWEKYDELRSIKSKGRPKGMHNRTYSSLLSQLDMLHRKFKGRSRVYAADAHCHTCYSDWMPLRSFGDLWIEGYTILDGDLYKKSKA